MDKPLALDAASAAALVDEFAAARVPLTVFQNRRWDGDFLTVRRLVESGTLGALTRFESRFERFRPELRDGAWRESGDAAEGGGLLLDLGAHLVDHALTLFGFPLRVYAEVDVRRPGAQVDDDVFVALEHPGGVRSHLWMSAIAPAGGRFMRASGTRAGIETPGLDPQEDQLAAGLRPGDANWGEGEPARLADADGERTLPIERGAYERFYAGVRDALRGDGAHARRPARRGRRAAGHRRGAAQRADGCGHRHDGGGRFMKTSLGIWAFGPMVTRFNPHGYKPELAGQQHGRAGRGGGRRASRA